MKRKERLAGNMEKNSKGISFYISRMTTDAAKNIQNWWLKVNLWNLYHTCSDARLIDHYAICVVNEDYSVLRKRKWLKTPLIYCKMAFGLLNSEFYKIVNNKEYDKTVTSIDEYNFLSNKITKMIACAFQLSIKESPLARNVLQKMGITAPTREELIKKAESSIKMLELKSSNLLSSLEIKKETTEKQELLDFYNNITSLDKLGFSISHNCTMLEYASKKRMAKEYVDRQTKDTKNG